MEKMIRTLLVLACFSLCGNAYAVNWGLTASYSAGDAEDNDNRKNIDGDNGFFSVGVTLDTGDVNRIFNYRGTLSYVKGEFDGDFDDSFSRLKVDIDYGGFAIDNTFGFRVGGNATTRVWIGPAIDLQFLGDAFSLTGGGSVGVDFYPATGSLFSFETGFRIGNLFIDTDDNDDFDDSDLELETTGFFVRGTVFFTRPQQ